jgi:hypothetical protein
MTDFFHLNSSRLAPGSIIEPGNWGRVIRLYGWNHKYAMRECALEQCRLAKFSHLPSRLNAAFVFPSSDEALRFRGQVGAANPTGFETSLLYRVRLRDESQVQFVADWRMVAPTAHSEFDVWPSNYWTGYEPVSGDIHYREILTTSALFVEERFD